jgi:hypothetical protein
MKYHFAWVPVAFTANTAAVKNRQKTNTGAVHNMREKKLN